MRTQAFDGFDFSVSVDKINFPHIFAIVCECVPFTNTKKDDLPTELNTMMSVISGLIEIYCTDYLIHQFGSALKTDDYFIQFKIFVILFFA